MTQYIATLMPKWGGILYLALFLISCLVFVEIVMQSFDIANALNQPRDRFSGEDLYKAARRTVIATWLLALCSWCFFQLSHLPSPPPVP